VVYRQGTDLKLIIGDSNSQTLTASGVVLDNKRYALFLDLVVENSVKKAKFFLKEIVDGVLPSRFGAAVAVLPNAWSGDWVGSNSSGWGEIKGTRAYFDSGVTGGNTYASFSGTIHEGRFYDGKRQGTAFTNADPIENLRYFDGDIIVKQSSSSSFPLTFSSNSIPLSIEYHKENTWAPIGGSVDYTDAANWSVGKVPLSTSDIKIPANLPVTISGDETVNNLEVEVNGAMTINSGGSLIVNGTSSGNVTYQRALGTNNWYLVSSPVAGETMTDMRANNSYATGSDSNIGFATYNPGQIGAASWTYFTNSSTDALTNGTGYSTKLSASGNLSFTGTINTEDVETSSLSTGFNLLGSPFTSYVNSATFLGAGNSANIDQTQIWLWDQAVETYEVKVAGDAWVLAPGQGFFVNATSAGTVTFEKSNQASTGASFKKSSRTELKLWMSNGEKNCFAKLYYTNTGVKGFDNGWEGELFGGVSNSFAVFTHLLEDNQGKKYQLQTLPNSEMENMIVPIGIIANDGEEIEFTIETMNLSSDLKVFLEDRQKNIFTQLDIDNAEYKVTLSDATSGTGRFYLHTRSSTVLSSDDLVLSSVSIFKSNPSTLKIAGLKNGKASISLFNIIGKNVLNTSFVSSNGVKEISLPKLAKGVYIVKIKTEKGKLNKKIILE